MSDELQLPAGGARLALAVQSLDLEAKMKKRRNLQGSRRTRPTGGNLDRRRVLARTDSGTRSSRWKSVRKKKGLCRRRRLPKKGGAVTEKLERPEKPESRLKWTGPPLLEVTMIEMNDRAP